MKRKKAKEKPQAKEKKPQIQESNAKYIFRGMVLTVLVAFAVLGVYFVANYENSSQIIKNMEEYESSLNEKNSLERDISAFAESFVSVYYTYSREDQNYESQLKEFTAGKFTLQPPTTKECTVVSAGVSSIEEEGSGYDVTIRAVIRWQTDDLVEYVNKNHLIKIPITVKDGNFGVAARPFFVSDQNESENANAIELLGNSASDEDVKQATSLTQNFLKAYFGKDITALDYLVTDSFPKKVMGGSYEFSKITDIRVANGADSVLFADVTFVIKVQGVEQTQRFILTMEKSDKYYVSKITSR